MHAAGDPRPVQCPFERCIDLRRAACVQIRHVAAEKPQVQRAIQAQSYRAAPGKLHLTRDLQVGVGSAQCDRINLQTVLRRPEMYWAGVFQPHVCVIHGQAREIRIHDDALRFFQRAVQRNISISVGVAAEFLQVQRGQQERVQVNIPDRHFPAQRVRISKSESIAPRNLSGSHCGAQFQMCRVPVRRQIPLETANDHLADPEIYHAKCPVA